MNTEFWHERWAQNEIGFHLSDVNPLLVKHFHQLDLAKGSRIFLPLCGKTRDIAWLLSQGYHVLGSELVSAAVEQLFAELEIKPKVTEHKNYRHYSAERLDIFAGDIFYLSPSELGDVHAVYDRAALVALPEPVRKCYTAHLRNITHKAPQLLLCFEYDQSVMDGPPFSISKKEVESHYRDAYSLDLVETVEVPGGLKGKCSAQEHVWLLKDSID